MRLRSDSARITEEPDIVLADAGYWHSEQINQLAGDGNQVLVPPDATNRRNTWPGWRDGRYSCIRHLLTTGLAR